MIALNGYTDACEGVVCMCVYLRTDHHHNQRTLTDRHYHCSDNHYPSSTPLPPYPTPLSHRPCLTTDGAVSQIDDIVTSYIYTSNYMTFQICLAFEIVSMIYVCMIKTSLYNSSTPNGYLQVKLYDMHQVCPPPILQFFTNELKLCLCGPA